MPVGTAIIAGIAGLAVAIITGFVTLRAKKLDLFGQREQRRAEQLRRGYHTVLAAYDIFWHYRCHAMLKDLGTDPPFDFKEKWHPYRPAVESMFNSGVDKIHENSLHYDRLIPALMWVIRVVFDGVNLRQLEAMPEDYEEARATVVKFSRIDQGIDKPVGKRFWKRLSKKNAPPDLAELTSEDTVRRIFAMVNNNPNLTYIYQSGPDDDPDDNPLLSFINRFSTHPPLLAASVAVSLGRIGEWKKAGVIEDFGPCDELETSCYEPLRLKMAEHAKAEADE